uniref:Erythromycin biosynthesis protein CIII-like C-terminal domain-containing protein n=2 Tax=Aplanochytrium stocchinoi TaxID=215587 RepID=A0A7S3LQQ6_9STRA|mmetsp:Transcript_5826/g.7352  ORF Transcript_5826/g.7352 Transcript_5826/m.7352 type:complete len:202 (-) Transcript_5826:521-1126(-)
MTGPWRLPCSSLQSEIENVKENKSLMNFLAKQPIFVTFGSMEHVNDILLKTLDAVSKINLPMLICAKPELTAELDKTKLDFDDSQIQFTYSIPFDFVFQKCRCVVHHGGAGTTASAAYAGIPSVVIPILQWSDQQYWARIVSDRNIGIHLPLAEASVKAIGAAVTSAMDLAESSKLVAENLNRQADGAYQAARLVFDYLYA